GEIGMLRTDGGEIGLSLGLKSLPDLDQPASVVRDGKLGLQLQGGVEVDKSAVQLSLPQVDQAAIADGDCSGGGLVHEIQCRTTVLERAVEIQVGRSLRAAAAAQRRR